MCYQCQPQRKFCSRLNLITSQKNLQIWLRRLWRAAWWTSSRRSRGRSRPSRPSWPSPSCWPLDIGSSLSTDPRRSSKQESMTQVWWPGPALRLLIKYYALNLIGPLADSWLTHVSRWWWLFSVKHWSNGIRLLSQSKLLVKDQRALERVTPHPKHVSIKGLLFSHGSLG